MEAGWENWIRLADHLGLVFGPRCEVVVHDFTRGYDHTIVHIVNGAVSGREEGGCPTSLFFEHAPHFEEHETEAAVYFSRTKEGRMLKSSTTFIRNAEGRIIGSLCLNLDVTDLYARQKEAEAFFREAGVRAPDRERFVKNVQEMMEECLCQVEAQAGKPAAKMTRREKKEALAWLDERGVLQISKANVRLCEFFGISKFTLYRYLDEIRGGAQGQEEEEEEI